LASSRGYDPQINYTQMEARWVELFKAYLRGLGHPSSERQISVSDEDRFNARNSSTLRPELFVQAISGSKYLPLLSDGGFKVRDIFMDCSNTNITAG